MPKVLSMPVRQTLMQSDTAVKRKFTCRVCNASMMSVLDLGEQYLVGFVDSPEEATLKTPLWLMMCENVNCNLIQLSHSVNPDLMYKEFWYRSGVTETMRKALRDVVDGISTMVKLDNNSSVLDIGCSDGTLLEFYPSGVKKVGIDPSNITQEYAQSKGFTIVNDYFSSTAIKAVYNEKFDAITACAMFYDLEDPYQFIQDCIDLMKEEGVLVIQMNYLLTMLENGAVDNICSEHITYFTLASLNFLIEMSGLHIVDVETNEVNGGSIRVYIRHRGIGETSERVKQILEHESKVNIKGSFDRLAEKIETWKVKLTKFLEQAYCENKTVLALGASTRGSTLLQTLKISNWLLAASERDNRKFMKMTVGTWLKIVPEDIGRRLADYFFVLPWFFKDEILEREKEWAKAGGKFIFPLPHPKIVWWQDEREVAVPAMAAEYITQATPGYREELL